MPSMESGQQDSYDVLASAADGQTESVKHYEYWYVVPYAPDVLFLRLYSTADAWYLPIVTGGIISNFRI